MYSSDGDVFEVEEVKLEPLSFFACPSAASSSSPPRTARLSAEFSEAPAATVVVAAKSRSRPQVCKVCGKVLSSPSSYYVHLKLHSGTKPFQCTLCEAAFCRKPYLEVHMRTHTGERPFQCNLCLKRFTQKSSLNTHRRVHTGERPYGCDLCDKHFAVKSYLVAHRWSHVSDHPLTCSHCNESFTSRGSFEHHMKKHVERKFQCGECGRCFAKESYLIRHHTRIHGSKEEEVNDASGDDVVRFVPIVNLTE